MTEICNEDFLTVKVIAESYSLATLLERLELLIENTDKAEQQIRVTYRKQQKK